MDFSFSDEQNMLRDTLSRYLDSAYQFEARQALLRSKQPWSADVWTQFQELGLTALPFEEQHGGLGGAPSDIVAIAELLGAHLTVEPYLSSVVFCGRALESSAAPAAKAVLEKIIDGAAIAAFAHEEGRGVAHPSHIALTARREGDGFRLDGEKRLVLGGAQADHLLVSARLSGGPGDAEGLALLLVDPKAPGVTLQPLRTIDGRSAAHIRFDGVATPSDHLIAEPAAELLEKVVSEATLALCAEAVGAMGALMRITTEYAATRKQFGVPIGSFQAIAHRLADMKMAYSKARSTLIYTAALAESGRMGARDVSILKGQAGVLGRQIGESAVQIHGGVGMTDELNVGHYLKRLLAIEAMFGGSDYHLHKVGAEPAVA